MPEAKEAAQATNLLSSAAAYAYQHFYSKPFRPPPDDADDALRAAWAMDFDPVHNIHRPNHGMADALRKAMLVPHVLDAYLKHYETGTYSGDFTKDAFGSMLPSEQLAMQLAMIFEVCGRESDIGFNDHPETFHRFHHASCNAYKQFRSATHENVDDDARDLVLEALERMYMEAKTKRSLPYKLVLERCHDLDLYRCYGKAKMERKRTRMMGELGGAVTAVEKLATLAEDMLRATGNRIMYSPTGRETQSYDADVFPLCSTSAKECHQRLLVVSGEVATMAQGESKEEDLSLGRIFEDSNFSSEYAKYKGDDPEEFPPETSDELLTPVRKLIDSWCKQQGKDRKKGREFYKKLHDAVFDDDEMVEELHSDVSAIAERLWTGATRFDGNGPE